MAKLKLGVHAGQQDIELDELRTLWRKVDEYGFDLLTCWDHLYESPSRDGQGQSYESQAVLAAMAVETRTIRIGCYVFCMGFRNPAILAKALTTIDHLSHGRLQVGLGAGWHQPEHLAFNVPLPSAKERLDKLSEGARIIRRMFTQESTTFDGKHFKVTNVHNIPQPVQARIPIIIGGGGEQRTLQIAALHGDGSNITYQTPEVFERKMDVLTQWCEKSGRDPASIDRSVQLHFLMSSRGKDPGPQRDIGIWGEAQQVIDRLGEYADGGAHGVNVAIRPPVDWDALQSYAEDVMPAFR
jgi:alkanesulfonate monooxygenase SsuD/methylene tetrahydromethanopterin reductase-like flavin-dependent oxidoreductase (luciferase family)